MKVNHIKQLFVALSLLLSAGTATAAQWKLAKTNLNAAGSKDTLTLEVSGNSFSFSSFQVDFTLSEGILLDGTPILGELANDHALTWSKQSDGSFRCVVYSAGNKDMKAPEGPVLRIPVVLAASFEGGKFTAKNGLLSNKASNGQSVKDLSGATLTAYKERAHLVVNVSGQEQVVNPAIAAGLSYTTIPEDKTLTVAYFKDDSCKIAATDNDRKEEGILYVKLSYAGDTDYAEFEEVYVMSLTSKIAIDASKITKPQTTGIKEGQLLSTSLLSGGSVKDEDGYTIAGTFVWTNGNAVMPAGKQSCSVTFYPDNSSYYNTAEVSVEVEVTPTYLVTATGTTGGTVNVLGKTEDDVYVKGQEISLVALSLPNYKFESWSVTGASETLPANDSIFVKADNNKTYTANFSPIMRAVTINHVGNGSLSVTAEGAKVASGAFLRQGTILQIVATPDVNSQLESLTINKKPLEGNKVTLTADLEVNAAFKPKEGALVSIDKDVANGSILLYKEDGSLIAYGSSVPVGTKLRAVALPDAGYSLDGSVTLSGVTGPTNDLWTVTGDVTAKAAFGAKKYMVKASAVSSNPTQTASGTITLEPSGEQPYGTEVRIASAEGQNGARLLTILANGKEISQNDVLTVTGDLTVTAVFDPRVNIEKTYILWPYQEYYYSGVSRNFVPFASQTYAGFSFEVLYKNTKGEKTAKAIDADNYTVLLHREEDGLYNEFKGEYKDGLVIHKSKVSVTEAPTNGGNPKTRPAEVDITSTTTNGVTKYVIEPNSDAAKKNYEGTVYYHSTKDPVNLSFGESILRAGGEPVSPMGYVRVTNGGMPYDATDGKVSIPAGITVTLEAVPAEGAKFSHWSDIESNPVDAKKNPREYVVAEGSTGVTPEFVGKDKLEFKLAQTSSVYNGAAQLVSVTGTGNEACQITFFFDEACTQPAVLKNVDKYYVRVYRSADAKYKEYTEVFPYAIEQAEPAITKWPDASDILLGHTLAESILQGGNPGIVAGTFAWSKPETAPTATGQQEVTFTPTDPNYKPVSSKIEVKVVSATFLDPVTPPVDPVDPENPDKLDQPDTPTGIESIEEGMSLYTANQSIFVNMPQQVALKVVDVSGIVLYEGSILGKAEIPVGHAGVYFVRCEAFGDSFVRKVVVR
uniref:InlB B-repeat-containing protein n=1 Tax=Parabacteroides distasonis TaxID=823 RepID=UPI003FEF85B1